MTTNGTLNNTSVSCYAQGVEGEMTQCVMDQFFAAGPSPGVIGLVMAGTLVTSLYVAGDGTVIVPAIVTILFGSILVPTLPPQFRTLAYTVVVVGITVAAFASYTRFTHQGGF